MHSNSIKSIAEDFLENPQGIDDHYTADALLKLEEAVTKALHGAKSAEDYQAVMDEVGEVLKMGCDNLIQICRDENLSPAEYKPLFDLSEMKSFVDQNYGAQVRPSLSTVPALRRGRVKKARVKKLKAISRQNWSTV